jgi:hypothetical protein
MYTFPRQPADITRVHISLAVLTKAALILLSVLEDITNELSRHDIGGGGGG